VKERNGGVTRRCNGNNKIPTVWSDAYCTDAASTNSTSKQRGVVDLARAEDLIALHEAPIDAGATWVDIATVHDPAFVEAVKTGQPRQLAQSQGFTWSLAFAEAVARIWTGHIEASRMALAEGMVLHPVSGAHHACYSRGSGFCTFNFLVGAARTMVREGAGRQAIIDLDAHPGDGTYALTGGDNAIALFDIAGGSWIDIRNDHRVEYHVARNAAGYRQALDRLPAFLNRVRPALVQYQAGMDPFEEDPVGGIDGITEAFLTERDRFVLEQVRARGIPLVVNLAGGYVRGVSERLHVNTIRVMAAASGTLHGTGPNRGREQRATPGPEPGRRRRR
jgi:acetoin utilization deacetylase AcuC-like enzyme